MAAQEKAGRLIKEFCSFSEGISHSCPTGPGHRGLSPPTSPNASLSRIHTSLDTRWIFVFLHQDHKFQVMDTCEGLYGGPLVSLHPPAAWIHHGIDCIALKATEKIPANFATLLWRLCSHGMEDWGTRGFGRVLGCQCAELLKYTDNAWCLGDQLTTTYCRLPQYFLFVGAENRCLLKDHFFYLKVQGDGCLWKGEGCSTSTGSWWTLKPQGKYFWFRGGWVITCYFKDKNLRAEMKHDLKHTPHDNPRGSE